MGRREEWGKKNSGETGRVNKRREKEKEQVRIEEKKRDKK